MHFEKVNIAAEPSPEYAPKASHSNIVAAIDFLLDDVTIHHFDVYEATPDVEKEWDVNLEIGFEIRKEQHAISCTMGYDMINGDQPVLLFEVTCVYTITEVDWDTMKKDSRFIIPSSFARHLSAVTCGVASGVLHSKIENSMYKTYPMALINTDDLPEEDITFEL